MKIEIRVPSVGESINEGLLTRWLKRSGEAVVEGEDLFELETEKTTMVIPSPGSGVLEIQVDEGAEVKVEQQVAVIDSEAEPTADTGEPASDAQEAATAAPADVTPVAESRDAPSSTKLSPAVRRVVEENDLDVDAIEGTGKAGRITKADALRAAAQKKPPEKPLAASATPVSAGPQQTSAAAGSRESERVPMSMLRRRTARRLVEAKQNAAHLSTFNEIDMQAVSDIRQRRRDEFEETHGVRLGYMSFFVKACCHALHAYPAVNAMIDGDDIVYHHYCNIGVAVSLDKGLIVPVVKDADRMTFAGIEQAIVDLAGKARQLKLSPDDLAGGTFSITNGGVFGSLLSTPIPAYPQTAILGMHSIQKRPVVIGDEIVVRPMMYVALTYDHRVIDGRDAIGFLKKVKELIEEPDRLLLES